MLRSIVYHVEVHCFFVLVSFCCNIYLFVKFFIYFSAICLLSVIGSKQGERESDIFYRYL